MNLNEHLDVLRIFGASGINPAFHGTRYERTEHV